MQKRKAVTANIDRDGFRKFLEENAKAPETVPEAMRLLEPFLLKAESGKYVLDEASELLAKSAEEAISMATDKEVTKAVLVSVKNPYPRPEWMCQKAHEASLRDSLGDSFRASLWASFRASLGDSFGASLWDSLRASPWVSLWDSFRASPWARLRDSLRASLGDSLGDNLWYSLKVSLFYHLGYTVTGDREKVARLTPLLELLPHAIPLGEKADEPGVWIVLCA